jgi:hypothetical protein
VNGSTDLASTDLLEFAVTNFEACIEFRATGSDGPCDECGWLEADHAGTAPVESALAEVIAVPVRTQELRRAS